ncbi:hypothetical protein D9M71_496620 [compost metagenome]
MRHQPFVGHGAERLDVEDARQVDVAGADEDAREVALQAAHHGFLHRIGEAPAGAEVGHPEAGQFLGAGLAAQPVELLLQAPVHRVEADLWITLTVAQLADGRQQRHLEEDHVQPGAFQAQAELALVDADLHVVGVEAEQPEEADEVGLEERDALQELQFLAAERQPGERLDLLADLR